MFVPWENTECNNIRIIGVPEEEKKKGYEKIFEEIIVENFPNMEKEMVSQVQEAQRVPYSINPRKNIPRHRLIKLTKLTQTIAPNLGGQKPKRRKNTTLKPGKRRS